MIYLYNEDYRRIRKVIQKADDYNSTCLRSKSMAVFIHEVALLLDKGIYCDKNGDRMDMGGKR